MAGASTTILEGASWAWTFTRVVAEIPDFAAMHEYLSTAPESPFVRMAIVQRRDEAGADVLRGLVLRRLGSDSTETVLQSEGDWYGVLDAKFGLPLEDVGAAEREQLVDARPGGTSGVRARFLGVIAFLRLDAAQPLAIRLTD